MIYTQAVSLLLFLYPALLSIVCVQALKLGYLSTFVEDAGSERANLMGPTFVLDIAVAQCKETSYAIENKQIK
jgi:hypothetical protein